jgi:hypothetical protein
MDLRVVRMGTQSMYTVEVRETFLQNSHFEDQEHDCSVNGS